QPRCTCIYRPVRYLIPKKSKSWSRDFYPPPLPQAPSDRNPARHATVKIPLQSETSLKCHLHCLGPHAAIAGYPCEWVATAAFALGAAEGFQCGWDSGRRVMKAFNHLTITAGGCEHNCTSSRVGGWRGTCGGSWVDLLR
ncbi:hypothetical protein CTAM01_02313, partial [Colletotrichum tamarilloi]